jgi:CHASE3 domain sensor protein
MKTLNEDKVLPNNCSDSDDETSTDAQENQAKQQANKTKEKEQEEERRQAARTERRCSSRPIVVMYCAVLVAVMVFLSTIYMIE